MSDRNHEPKAKLATLASTHAHLDQAHSSPRCLHVKSNGVRCGSPAMRRSPYCFFHDRFYLEPADDLFPPLEDPNAVQIALMRVLERLRREALRPGPLDLRAVNSLLYGLQTAAFNSKHTRFDWPAFHRDMATDDPLVHPTEENDAREEDCAREDQDAAAGNAGRTAPARKPPVAAPARQVDAPTRQVSAPDSVSLKRGSPRL